MFMYARRCHLCTEVVIEGGGVPEMMQGSTIPVLHIKHKNPRFTLLFSHGNAEDIGGYTRASRPHIERFSAKYAHRAIQRPST